MHKSVIHAAIEVIRDRIELLSKDKGINPIAEEHFRIAYQELTLALTSISPTPDDNLPNFAHSSFYIV